MSRDVGANPKWLGGEMAFSLVLHRWTQTLVRHLHLHALVAGGALAADGAWVSGKPGFLFPAPALSIVFRGKFMAAIIAAHAAGQLQPDKRQEQLPANVFIQRFMQHVLPLGLKRIRHYGVQPNYGSLTTGQPSNAHPHGHTHREI